MKVHLTSCETGPGAWRDHVDTLKDLWLLSSQRHQLVGDPNEADVVLIGNIREEHYYQSLRRHPVINNNPEKCFLISDADYWQTVPLLRGIYASTDTRWPFPGRYRTGAYTLYHPDFHNPLIENHAGDAFDSPKEYLASFVGRNSAKVRDALFRRNWGRGDIHIADTSDFNLFVHDPSGKMPRQEQFARILIASKFAICPRGAGTSSIRLFEAMKLGIAPVILSDHWEFPKGPDWASFSIRAGEGDLDNLESILAAHEPRYQEMGRLAREAYQRYFARDAYFDFLVDQVAALKEGGGFSEKWIWRARHLLVGYARAKQTVRDGLKRILRR